MPEGRSKRTPVGGIGISNPQRVIDSQSGATKLQLAEYYAWVGERLLPHLRGRPLSIVRAPEGIDGESFFQRHCGRLKMPHMRALDRSLDPEHARLIQADHIRAVIEAVQMGTVEFHTWNARSDRIDRPDRVIFDLDPDKSLEWSPMAEATSMTLTLLDELGLQAFLKTSGGRGMHVVVPIDRRHSWDTVRAFAQGVSQRLAEQAPERLVAKMGEKNRVGKVFVDYLRNQRGASTVAAYSVRARPGLGVSVPIGTDELPGLDGANQWTILNLRDRLEAQRSDPWAAYGATRQGITRAMLRKLDVRIDT